jgi:hypothetical protein
MPGVKGKSGRKTKAQELGLIALLDRCFTKAAREACIEKLAEDCDSDEFHIRHESRKLLLAYTFGKPHESVQHLGEGGGPIEIIVNHVKRSAASS